jgi:ribosomal protein S18 acetylase RimI-like enzyme
MLTSRPAMKNDAAFLEGVFLRAMRNSIERCRGCWDEGKERAQFREQFQIPETRIIEKGAKNVGFFMTLESDSDVHLHTICIAPEYQGQGFGTTIIRWLINDARAQKRSVSLSVLKTNESARSFYERLGFAVIEERENHYLLRFASQGTVSETPVEEVLIRKPQGPRTRCRSEGGPDDRKRNLRWTLGRAASARR